MPWSTAARSWRRRVTPTPVRATVGMAVAAMWLALVATAANARPAHPAHPAAGEPDTDLVRQVFALDRAVGYLALALLCGGWLFLALVWPAGGAVRRTRLLLAVAWCVGFMSALAGLGLQAATVERAGLGGVVDLSAVADVLDTPAGRAWTARAFLYLLALPLLGALGRDPAVPRAAWWRVGALCVALGLLRAPGLAGHSSEGPRSVVGAVADLVHLAGVAAWIGGLVVLAVVVLPRRRPDELLAVVPRFSSVAQVAVAAATVAGVALTWAVRGGFGGLLDSDHGRILLVKVALLGAVLLAAAASKRWVDDRLRLAVALRGDRPTVRPFVVSVAAEVALAVALLGAAGLLVGTSPGT